MPWMYTSLTDIPLIYSNKTGRCNDLLQDLPGR